MNDDCDMVEAGNPFSTRYVRPGAMHYDFTDGTTAAGLVERLAANNWQGQIVGEHGSGKSTLLAELMPVIRAQGRMPTLIALHDGQRRLPVDLKTVSDLDSKGVLVIDGYEQLGVLARFAVRRFCQRSQCGLLATAHKPLWLPQIYRTTGSLAFVQKLVDRLLVGDRITISSAEVAAIFQSQNGNVRDVLFDLYDLYEERS